MTVYCPACESAKVYRVNLVDKTVYEDVRTLAAKNPQNKLERLNEDSYYGSAPAPKVPGITAGYCPECNSLWAPIGGTSFATITIGSVTTVDNSQQAEVINVGNNVNAVLNFVVPSGPQGPQGLVGPQGETGPQGATGPQGPTGPVAGAPTLALTETIALPSTGSGSVVIGNISNRLRYRLENNGPIFEIGRTNFIDESYTTSALAAEAVTTFSLNLGKCGILFSLTVNQPCWLTMYSSEASRTSDATRLITADPIAGSGVLVDIYPTSASTIALSPSVLFFNTDATTSEAVYFKLVNKASSTQAIQINLKGFRLS
jgi:hypothetical protein